MSTHVVHALQAGNFSTSLTTSGEFHEPVEATVATTIAEDLAVKYPGNKFAVAQITSRYAAQVTAVRADQTL